MPSEADPSASKALIRPIDPDTARAIEEAAKLGGKLVDAGTKAGGYLDRVVGRLPDNVIGLLIGDWIAHKRIRRWAELQEETMEILREHGVAEPYADVSPSIAVPLIEAALDETRDGLKLMWARLLATALDPAKTNMIRGSFIAVIKAMDPADVRIMECLSQYAANATLDEKAISGLIDVDRLEVDISIINLRNLGCILPQPHPPGFSAFGRGLMRACHP